MDKIAASIAQVAAEAGGKVHRAASIAPVEISPALQDALDAWITDQPDPKPSRPEAIRYALTDWLTGQEYVRHHEDPEGSN